jgi:hypothetical protein
MRQHGRICIVTHAMKRGQGKASGYRKYAPELTFLPELDRKYSEVP